MTDQPSSPLRVGRLEAARDVPEGASIATIDGVDYTVPAGSLLGMMDDQRIKVGDVIEYIVLTDMRDRVPENWPSVWETSG